MHIPEGQLSWQVCAITGAVSLGAVAYSLHKLKGTLAEKTVPFTGMISALVFAGQMVNFPLIGTSGHLLGGVLAAVILGPWAGCLALTLVLIVQCLLFGDGGILALGANVLHMAVIGSIGGYAVYSAVRRLFANSARGTIVAAVTASWLTVIAAAGLFCFEFWLSHANGNFKFGNIFVVMVSVHSAIGVGESVITGVVIGFVLKQRPDLIYSPSNSTSIVVRMTRVLATGFVIALAVAAFLAPFASSMPDGLNAVAERFQFDQLERDTPSVLSEYSVSLPFETWQGISVSVAAIGGTLATATIALLLGRAAGLTPAPTDDPPVK